MIRTIILLILLLIRPVLADDPRKDLPPDVDRIRNQRLSPVELAGIAGRATTEKYAFSLSGGLDGQTLGAGLNPYRILKRRSDMFHSYRSIPWWLRNTQVSVKLPTGNGVVENAGLELKWGLYKKSHRWDEHWDQYFPEIAFPEDVNEVTDEWLDSAQKKLAQASALVDSLFLIQGNNGVSFAVSADRQNGEWEHYAFSFIGSFGLWEGFTTFNGAVGEFPDDINVVSVKFAGQYLREFWPTISDCGGAVASLAGSMTYATQEAGFGHKAWDWQIVPSANLPTFIEPRLRFLISYVITREEGKFFSGITYQVLPGK